MGKLRPLTVAELIRFTHSNIDGAGGLDTIQSVTDFVKEHASHRCLVFSRGEDGRIRAVMYGWPVDRLVASDEGGTDESLTMIPGGDCLYINMLVVDADLAFVEGAEAIWAMRERVEERWGRSIDWVCYHRGKYDDRFKVHRFNPVELSDG